MIPALVLTAGLATRLRPLSLIRAKAALPIAGEPIVTRILRQLRDADVSDVVLNLHHLPHTISAITGDGSHLGMRVRYSWEVPVLGSAGGPRQALGIIGASPFLIINGDTLAAIDLGKLVTAHRNSDALITMAVVPRTEPERYGGIRLNDEGALTGITKRGVDDDSFHFVGIQVAEAEAFADLPARTPAESTGDLYLRLARTAPGSVRGCICEGEFFDVGTPGDYVRTAEIVAARDNCPNIGAGCRVDSTAQLSRSVLWDNVIVEAGACLDRCVVTDRVVVPSGTAWSGSVLRRAEGELGQGETQVGDLAVSVLT